MSNPADPFEFVKNLWGQMAVPGFGLTGAATPGAVQMPSFDPRELEKRLAELKQVKQWLEMNLNMMGLQINTIEMQLAAMSGLNQAAAQTVSAAAPESVGGSHSKPSNGAQPAPWMNPQSWVSFMQQQADATRKSAEQALQGGAQAMQATARSAAPKAAPAGTRTGARASAAKRAPGKKKA